MKVINFITLTLTLALGISCQKENTVLQFNEKKIVENIEAPVPTDNNIELNFNKVKTEIFDKRCIGCHQKYSVYENVFNELSAIQSAVASDRMPKVGGPLTEALKKLLTDWIAIGAPKANGNNRIPDSANDEVLPNYQSINTKIISVKCIGCHNPDGMANFLDLSSKESIIANKDRVFKKDKKFIDLENPKNSFLLEVLADEDDDVMPPVWSNISRVSLKEIAVIEEWIRLQLP